VRNILPTNVIAGEIIKEDKLEGSEEYGDSNGNDVSWGIKFKELEFTHFKVESYDMSYSKSYFRQ